MPDSEELKLIDKTLVEPIVLDDALGRWQFAPEPNITPYEAALIGQLFTVMVLRHKRLDWREYLTRQRRGGQVQIEVPGGTSGLFEQCDLARHFRKVE